MKLYVSGPMTGLPDWNFPAFNTAAAKVRALGHEAVNPVDVNPDPATPWEMCLRADIKALCDCDGIVLLPGWEKSKGAQLELHIAHRLQMSVHFIETLQ
jgi:Domain of unknown function (DUF4406)